MILLHKPYKTDQAWKLVKDCLDTTWISSAGKYVTEFEERMADFCGISHAVAVINGTSALHLALLAHNIGKGDLVILPNLSFVASANPVPYVGASPIFIDVEEETWQMDLDLLETFLEKESIQKNDRTILKNTGQTIKAILPVHLLGNVNDMDKLLQIAEKYNLIVVEDAAEAVGSFYKGKHAGSFGSVGCLSFNGNKILSTGGGGMVITNDGNLAERIRHLSTQAKVGSEYFHDQIGYNYRLTNVAAAIGLSQLDLFPEIQKNKSTIYSQYRKKLPETVFQSISEDVSSNHWLITIRTDQKDVLIRKLREKRIQARSLWVPLNRLPMYEDSIYVTRKNISWRLYQTCLSLPSSADLRIEEVDIITDIIKENGSLSIFSGEHWAKP